MRGLEGRIHAAIADRSDAVTELDQLLPHCDRLAADRLLWLDVAAEHGQESLTELPLAAYQLRGRGQVRGLQRQLGIGRGGSGWLHVGRFRFRLRRPGRQCVDRKGGEGAGVGECGGRRPRRARVVLVDLVGAVRQVGRGATRSVASSFFSTGRRASSAAIVRCLVADRFGSARASGSFRARSARASPAARFRDSTAVRPGEPRPDRRPPRRRREHPVSLRLR